MGIELIGSDSIVIDDITKMYLQEIQQYPLLSTDKLNELVEEYRNGNIRVKEEIINSNLRLVVSIARRYATVTNSMKFLDLIQEGNLGLMEALETYDMKKGSFSTCATWCIRKAITRSISNKENIIRIPVHLIDVSRKYKNLINEYYEKYKKVPDDVYIKKILNITDETLEYLKIEEIFNVTSINQKIGLEDSECNEISNTIPTQSDDYENAIDNLENYDMMNVIKHVLRPIEYYVLYYRILNNDKKTLEQIGKTFGVTRVRIGNVERDALKKVKPYISEDKRLYRSRLNKIKIIHGKMYSKLNLEPINPNDIYVYEYIKEKLTEIEQKILYLRLFSEYEYTLDDIRRILGIAPKEFNVINNHLKRVIEIELNCSQYKLYEEKIRKKLGTRVYNIKHN